MRRMRKTWTPIPARWFSDSEFLDLSAVDLKVLLLLWSASEDGTVPADAKKARALCGLPVKAARVEAALLVLVESGFLKATDGPYILTDFARVFGRNSAKNAKRREKTAPQKPMIAESSSLPSRARSLSPSGRDKREEERSVSLKGRPPSSLEEKRQFASLQRILEEAKA